MTELETLKRAQIYMEKLANGINPIDGISVPDDDVINNVRLSRCFFFVADVLRQVIDNGGVSQQKKPSKAPFFLSVEKRSAFAFSSTPISISEVTKRINALRDDENMTAISYHAIRDWLISLGMLEEVLKDGRKSTKCPTLQGNNIGITLENRTGLKGDYSVIVYNLMAQHFILDHLDAVMDLERTKEENQGQPWSQEHERCLLDLYRKGVPINEIAITLKRNNNAIRARLKTLGLSK